MSRKVYVCGNIKPKEFEYPQIRFREKQITVSNQLKSSKNEIK